MHIIEATRPHCLCDSVRCLALTDAPGRTVAALVTKREQQFIRSIRGEDIADDALFGSE